MVRNKEKLELATQYRKRGFSYSEIAKICEVSKSTVSAWLAKKAFSKKVKQDNIEKAARENVKRISLLNKSRQTERKARYAESEHGAETEFKHYKLSPLFISGLMLYRASGDLTNENTIRLTTNDIEQHKVFIHFITEYAGITKNEIRFWLLLPEGQNDSITKQFWSKKIKLPKTRFGKTQFVSQNKNRPLHNGTGNTIIGNTVLKRKLIRWIELVLKEL